MGIERRNALFWLNLRVFGLDDLFGGRNASELKYNRGDFRITDLSMTQVV